MSDPNAYCTKGYFEQAASYLNDYLVLNPSFNGDGRRVVERNISVFQRDNIDESVIAWTLMGKDTQNIPDALWDGLLELGKPSASLEKTLTGQDVRSSPG